MRTEVSVFSMEAATFSIQITDQWVCLKFGTERNNVELVRFTQRRKQAQEFVLAMLSDCVLALQQAGMTFEAQVQRLREALKDTATNTTTEEITQ